MPRERVELVRQSPFKKEGKIYVLSYEGNNTEPQYYEALREKLKYKDFILYIVSLKRDKSDTNSAPKYVFQKLKDKKSEYNFKDTDEFWMIVDKDRWKLDKWVEKCKQEKNFNIAISNPCFEFWLLLHVIKIDDLTQEEIEKISKNEKISNNKRFIDQLLTNNLGEPYNKSNIQPERFIANIQNAIEQARLLNNNDIMNNIGSHNYLLVQKLID